MPYYPIHSQRCILKNKANQNFILYITIIHVKQNYAQFQHTTRAQPQLINLVIQFINIEKRNTNLQLKIPNFQFITPINKSQHAKTRIKIIESHYFKHIINSKIPISMFLAKYKFYHGFDVVLHILYYFISFFLSNKFPGDDK